MDVKFWEQKLSNPSNIKTADLNLEYFACRLSSALQQKSRGKVGIKIWNK